MSQQETQMETDTDLQELPGVGPATADKLRDAGYDDLMSIAVASPGVVCDAVDVGESTATKIILSARQQVDIGGFETGEELLEQRENVGKITTMSDNLDDLLGGGIETQSITEWFGEFGSGKTQVCHQLAVSAQLAKDGGGLGGEVVWIDTENTFRPERARQMAEALDMDPEKALERIHVARAYNSHHQMLLVDEAMNLAKKHEIRLMIVDSLTGHFRAEYVGRGTLAERQQTLNRHMHDVQQFTDVNNAAAVVTNQVHDKPDAFFGDPTKPIGGHIVGHMATFRLYLRKSKGEKRIARLMDSPALPEGEAVIKITGEGIRDGD